MPEAPPRRNASEPWPPILRQVRLGGRSLWHALMDGIGWREVGCNGSYRYLEHVRTKERRAVKIPGSADEPFDQLWLEHRRKYIGQAPGR